MNKRVKMMAMVIAAFFVVSSVLPVWGEVDTDDDDAVPMMLDVLFLRPTGLVATIVGTAVFIVALPFSVPTGSVGKAGRTLVSDPFLWTFDRPLGEWPERSEYVSDY